MGNVACCKKPNEIIEDADLIKKSTMRNNHFQENISTSSNQQNPFINMNLNNQNDDIKIKNLEEENKLIDLEKNNIDHEPMIGPSDNMRKKKLKNLQIHSISSKEATNNESSNNNINYSKSKSKNEYDETENIQQINKNKIINANININTQIKNNENNRNQNQNDEEKGPMDRVRRNREKKINNIIGKNEIGIINENNIMEEPINSDNKNYKIRLEKENINLVNQQQMNFKEKIPTENNKYFVQPTNQSIEFVNNSNYIKNSLSVNGSTENYPSQPSQVESQFPKDITNLNKNEDTTNKEEILHNNQNNNQDYYQNEPLEDVQIPQNTSDGRQENNYQLQENVPNLDIPTEDDEDPKDSNEVYQKPKLDQDNIDNNENSEDNDNERDKESDGQIKEAYIQNPDGKIYPTKQLSDSEIANLYNQCQSKGETEPDDDFSPDTYKKFYPENDPFFIFDKGEISQGQIITSPEDINHLEIYEGEINENNKKHGFGVATTPQFVRKGTWRNGEFTGWGRESRRNRDVLEGKFVNGKVNGKGLLKNNRGNIYVGDFVNSQREGYGELQTNRIHYIGEFKGDQLNGNGVIEFIKEGHKYEGEFKNNEINGRGIFRWKNGDIYEGEMTNGKMNGHGTYKYSNGQIYDGDYIDGLREGKGRIIVSNQVVYEGEFKGGHRIEQGNIIYSNRTNENNINENIINNEMEQNYDNNE